MNTPPTNPTTTGISATQIASTKCLLLNLAISNTSGATRFYCILDVASAPSVGNPQPGTPASMTVAAGQTAKFLPVDASNGLPFSNGIRVQAYSDSLMTVPAPSDSNTNAWIAPLA